MSTPAEGQRECIDMAERELLFEGIAMRAVADICAARLKYPFGFHVDTGIREFLYAKLQWFCDS